MLDGRIEKGQATRRRVVAAARETFGTQGYDGASTEAIREAAGVSRGSLYHHFATKESIFDAVLDDVGAEVAQRIARSARGRADPADRMQAGCAAWLRMARDPQIQQIALIDAPAIVGWSRWRELDERHTLGGLRANLTSLAKQGRLPPALVDPFAHMVLAAVNEAALLIARSEDPRVAAKTGQAAVDALLARLIDAPAES